MHASAQHLLQLINDILDLAKVESGKIDFQPEPVDLRELVSRGDRHRQRARGERENPADGRGRSGARRVAPRSDAAQAGAVQLPVERHQVHARRGPRRAPRARRRATSGSASRWKTPASASGPKTSTGCSSSSSSSMPAPPRSSRGRGSASRSPSGWSRRRAARSACAACWDPAARSSRRCRSTSRRNRADDHVAIDGEGAVKTVLIVDDDAASLALVERILEAEGFETRSRRRRRRRRWRS